MKIREQITNSLQDYFEKEKGTRATTGPIQLQVTRKDFTGDITLVVFPLLKFMGMKPEEAGRVLGEHLAKELDDIKSFNVVKGFLNLEIAPSYWKDRLDHWLRDPESDIKLDQEAWRNYMVEYSSPNTNKPLHLGHIRNNLIGYAISGILESLGHKVYKVNLVNDRGIHICKSMLAYRKWGLGEKPGPHLKGDQLVGKYYVLFEQEAKKDPNLIKEAQELLRHWERNDKEVVALWQQMNEWVYEGFNETYKRMGVSFDKIYYESETYKLGKQLVLQGLKHNVFIKRPDGSVWADLSDRGLDQKLLLRSDGTSVYITQDLGTAHQRFQEYDIDEHIYVVGNEQNYHFQVLKILLEKLDFSWATHLYHLSYGMVELPEGKMKSREGKVVDADDLMDEMYVTAKNMADELGKLEGYTEKEKEEVYRIIGMGALKYFILKVDPKKKMLFDPKESIDFNGNTGPFIQYTHARINSVLRKAEETKAYSGKEGSPEINAKEQEVIKLIARFPESVRMAAEELNPSLILNHIYELAREFNQFYHDYTILSEKDPLIKDLRIDLTRATGEAIRRGMNMVGIEVPERM